MEKDQITNLNKYRTAFKALLTVMIFTLLAPGYSQTLITTGTTLKVMQGTTLISIENLNVGSGGILDNQGTVVLKKNLANNNALANSVGSGTFIFSGTANQVVSGQGIFQNLTENNAAGLSVTGNTQVNGILNLSSGLVTLNAANLKLGTSAVVSGAPSSGNMVVPVGSAQLQKEFQAAGSFTFPVGDATGTAEYSPVTLQFNSGVFTAGNTVGISLTDAPYPGTATSYISRYWNVSQSGISGFSCNATFSYVPADVSGTESNIFSFKVDPTLPWVAYNAANSTLHQLTVHGLSSFGTFTGNLGNGSPPPPIRSVQDETVNNIRCADAQQTLVIAGNGTTFEVMPGGSITDIAGQNIIYLPGTTVHAGGYLHGYISTLFCSVPNPVLPPVLSETKEGFGTQNATGNSITFLLYPNPTAGWFTVELRSGETQLPVHVEIFGILGEKIFSEDIKSFPKQQFSLNERPAGVYLVHVSSGKTSQMFKVIRQ